MSGAAHIKAAEGITAVPEGGGTYWDCPRRMGTGGQGDRERAGLVLPPAVPVADLGAEPARSPGAAPAAGTRR